MEKVRRMMEADVSLPTAIKESLKSVGLDLVQFAEKYQLNEKAVSNGINGNVKPSRGLIDALIAEFGGTPFEWRYALWQAARPDEDVELEEVG